ncbi:MULTISPECIES: lysozyme inhibitor LprI family protein [Stenotrophomonas]|uniref:Lysozyme inhibitor LprI N-terminal domain-containing protein n=1 Tax=Stenotrophomonas forensis TaxID=2871169 RepID=A0ABY7Y4N6_9GAMM|nr:MULTISPECIES: hypothetical protein [Stenotrophomonas]QJP20810.1 hypothetical protein HKK60_15095 [Stenotrophomonas maltophilia]WDM64935.1 hypothetical protein K5L94_06515 [Stenotrophomonas sp. DFS-20110405]HDS1037975.1 hypothetical protein [Stenotrophomonas maltophilia]HDS1042587.1 hypothetical protein [Stenotrophomonas maltophilia]
MTLDLVRSIIQRELGATSAAANLSAEQLRSVLPISLAHPTSFDEKISRYSCEADLAAPFNNPGQDVYKLRLEYTSQAVNGQHLAEVQVLPGDLIGIGAAISSNVRSQTQAMAPAAAAPVEASQAVDVDPAYDSAMSTKADDYQEPNSDEPLADGASTGPSFDCVNASSAVEQMICADPDLARLDKQTAEAFGAVRTRSMDPGEVAASQGRWRRTVRDVCTDEACVEQAYQARLAELK